MKMEFEPCLRARSFEQLARDLSKPGQEIAQDLTDNPSACHLLHMGIGVASEAGELLDALKKAIIYQRPLDRQNVVEEIGDVRFYLAGLMNELGITEMDILEACNAKLAKRYASGGYSDQQAQDRADKKGETDALD